MRVRRVLLLAPLLALGAATGCSSTVALPADVTVDLYQTRLDVAERVIEISVANGSATPLTVTSAELVSDAFGDGASWPARDGGATVPAGATVDLPISVPAAACDAAATSGGSHRVRLGFVTDGRAGEVEIAAADRHGQLGQLRAQDCLAEQVARVASITAITAPSIGAVAGSPAILLPLTITPTGGDGSVEIVAVRSTVLLTMLDAATGAPLDAARPAVRVSGSDAPSTLVLPVAPGRCDAHVIAEDKQGTVLTVEVLTHDGSSGTILVHADDATRNAIYAAVLLVCGLAAG